MKRAWCFAPCTCALHDPGPVDRTNARKRPPAIGAGVARSLLAELAGRPFVLSCVACDTFCTDRRPCACCAIIGRSFSGAKRIRGLRSPHDRWLAATLVDHWRAICEGLDRRERRVV